MRTKAENTSAQPANKDEVRQLSQEELQTIIGGPDMEVTDDDDDDN
ncbi:bacteriocin [Flammeovirgaceae bacterium SG7u.111]|nr:bacteriocin [Flammeovirgaceae bacterium SG7u.132]WPO35012.1 bacteriocin [Flammeovirgaceae bacterium SG7u.111]